MSKLGFSAAEILVPKTRYLARWSVVACDQYTSQPDYWARLDRTVGDAPSALRIIYPEAYLGEAGGAARTAAINAAMRAYLNAGIFETLPGGFVYVERTLASGKIRRGLVGKLDLELYDYTPGAKSPIRPTEGTVESRLPPRVLIRENAPLEIPHIMMLIDDPAKRVIEPLAADRSLLAPVYDIPLPENGGRAAGYFVGGERAARLETALGELAQTAAGEPPLLIAAGDGNHSLAAAKVCYERLKAALPEREYKNHPARWALVELVNLHDDALEFEPIHRVVTGVNPAQLLAALAAACETSAVVGNGGQSFTAIAGGERTRLFVGKPASRLAAGTLQHFLDGYLAAFGGEIDYIHGDAVAVQLADRSDAVAFLLPAMDKSELFPTVLQDGALPRKTFSMGHAHEKRFYLECRAIQP